MYLDFWAQSLDNSSSDYIESEGRIISNDETEIRQNVVRRFSEISTRGKCVYEKGNVRIFILSPDFLIEVISANRDVVGRFTPIVCCGRLPDSYDTKWAREVIIKFREFAQISGRNLTKAIEEEIFRSLDQLLKKKIKRKLARWGIFVTLLIVGIVALVWLIVTLKG